MEVTIANVLNEYNYKYRYIDSLNNMGYAYSLSDITPLYFINDKQTYITQL